MFYCTSCQNISHHQQQKSYTGLHSPRQSYSTHLWHDHLHYCITKLCKVNRRLYLHLFFHLTSATGQLYKLKNIITIIIIIIITDSVSRWVQTKFSFTWNRYLRVIWLGFCSTISIETNDKRHILQIPNPGSRKHKSFIIDSVTKSFPPNFPSTMVSLETKPIIFSRLYCMWFPNLCLCVVMSEAKVTDWASHPKTLLWFQKCLPLWLVHQSLAWWQVDSVAH